MSEPKYDPEARLLKFSARVIRVTESLGSTRAANPIADRRLRSGTSPYGNHGEAEGAIPRNDFIHKLRVCPKELRAPHRWLRLVQRAGLVTKPDLLSDLIRETDELVRIIASSISTAVRNRKART